MSRISGVEIHRNIKKYWAPIILIVFIVEIIMTGLSLIPYPTYQILSQNPFNSSQETILLPLIGYLTSMDSPITFTGLCLTIILISTPIFVIFVNKRFGILPTIIFSTILITSPIFTILLTWIGSPDSLTFLFTIPFLFINSPVIFLFLALIGTTNHIAFLIAAVEILILRKIGREKVRIRHLIATLVGGIIGFIIVRVFVAGEMGRFNFIFSLSISEWIDKNLSELPMTLFSFFNIQWLIILSILIMFFKKDKIYYCSMIGILFLNYAITFFTLDSTRVFSLISWGVLIHSIFHSYDLVQANNNSDETNRFLKVLIFICIASIFSPRFYSWYGKLHFTSPNVILSSIQEKLIKF